MNILRLGKSVSNFLTCLATSLDLILEPTMVRSVEDPLSFPSSASDEGPFPICIIALNYSLNFIYLFMVKESLIVYDIREREEICDVCW